MGVDVFDYVAASDTAGIDTGDLFGDVKRLTRAKTPAAQAAAFRKLQTTEYGGVIDDIGRSVSKAASSVGGAVGSAVGAVTNNPLWDIAQTGASFIPGVGNAVSAGMAGAAAVGRGESLKDIGLSAARGALPGGAVTRAAFDIATGAIRGHGLSATALRALRNQVPGGELGRGAFDAAVAVASGAPPDARKLLRAGLSAAERAAFDAATNATPHAIRSTRRLPKLGGRTTLHRVPIVRRPSDLSRPFPSLGPSTNRAAGLYLRRPELRGLTAARFATLHGMQTRDARTAMAELLKRHGAKLRDVRDVGEFDTIDSCAARYECKLPEDLGAWASDDTAAIEAVKMPPMGVTRGILQSLFDRGDANIKKALLAHELMAQVARNTGELQGTGWVIRSGDYPYKVAQLVTGDANRWREIASANPTMKVYTDDQGRTQLSGWIVGKRVELPPGWFPSAVPPPAVTVSTGGSGPFPAPSEYPLGYPSASYVVREGDTGEKVAERITGSKSRWRELLTTNPTLADPKYGIALYAGKVIQLPRSWVKAQPDPEIIAQTGPLPPLPTPPVIAPPTPAPAPAPSPAAPPPIVLPPPGFDLTPPLIPISFPVPIPTPSPVPTDAPIPGPSTPATPEPEPDGPIVTGASEQIALVQIMLASFFREHPTAVWTLGEPFGAPGDMDGEWSDRTSAALGAFQKWWNQTGRAPVLPTDGLPDGPSIGALIKVTGEDGKVEVKESIALAVDGVPQATAGPAPATSQKSGGGLAAAIAIAALPFVLDAL